MISRSAPAKINLFLRIVRRRSDGYHEIETLFQRLTLADRLDFRKVQGSGLRFHASGIPTGCERMEDNLIARAYRLLCPSGPGVEICLEKQIPVGGGLGGGSSNAAAALLGLRELLDLDVSDGDLAEMALQLGADVPFFLGPMAAVGRGVGEQLAPLRHLSAFHVVLAFPDYGVSTAEVYQRFDPEGDAGPESTLDALIQGLETNDLPLTLDSLYNSMEPLAFAIRPELGHLRDSLEEMAGRPVRMSGSGSTLFTLTPDAETAQDLCAQWQTTCQTCATQFATGA